MGVPSLNDLVVDGTLNTTNVGQLIQIDYGSIRKQTTQFFSHQKKCMDLVVNFFFYIQI